MDPESAGGVPLSAEWSASEEGRKMLALIRKTDWSGYRTSIRGWCLAIDSAPANGIVKVYTTADCGLPPDEPFVGFYFTVQERPDSSQFEITEIRRIEIHDR